MKKFIDMIQKKNSEKIIRFKKKGEQYKDDLKGFVSFTPVGDEVRTCSKLTRFIWGQYMLSNKTLCTTTESIAKEEFSKYLKSNNPEINIANEQASFGSECYSYLVAPKPGDIFITTLPNYHPKTSLNDIQLRWIETLKTWIGFDCIDIKVDGNIITVNFLDVNTPGTHPLFYQNKSNSLYCLTTLRRIFEFYEQIYFYFDFIDYLIEEEGWTKEQVEEEKEFLYHLMPMILFIDKGVNIVDINNFNHADLYLHSLSYISSMSIPNQGNVKILPESKRIEKAFMDNIGTRIFGKFQPIEIPIEILKTKEIKEILEYVKSV